MTGFKSVKEVVTKAYDTGKMNYSVFRKVPAIATTLGLWTDLSGAPGVPKPNFYATTEMTAETLDGTFGLWHGGGGQTTTDGFKFLHKAHIFSASAAVSPAKFIICDYLLYYPLIDMDDTALQVFNNYPTGKSLPRYTDGLGVQAMLVATNPFVGGASFQLTYTNERGETDRKSQWMMTNITGFIGSIVNSGISTTLNWPFVLLQTGDRGIRSVQNIEFNQPNGGLAVLVLVKPLANISTYELTAMTEVDYLINGGCVLPKIYDGAYLNMIYSPNGSALSVPIQGAITTVWS